MAYKIQKQQKTVEDLELYDENGNKALTITVQLDRAGMAEKLSEKHLDLIYAKEKLTQLQKEIKDGDGKSLDKAMTETGNAVIAMFEAVFGKKDSDKIREFYNQNTTQMCYEVLPFIIDVVLPKVRKLGQAKRKKTMTFHKTRKFF